jgi:Fic family protein
MHAIMQDTVRGKNREPGQFRKDQNWIGPWACTIKDATYVVRQHNREPGQFRKNQNWIGPWGGSIEDAHFVPPSPLQMLDHLQAWEGYLNNDDSDCLVQAAVVHAQFELIHPFKDGNGRIGRLLIPLFLFNKGALSHPMFYLSAYLEENRYEYHERLRGISESGQWSEWIAFFLKAVSIQARDNAERIQRTLTLYEQMKEHIQEFIYSKYTNQFLDALFERPIFQTSDLVKRSGLAKKTVMPLLRQLKSEMVFRSLCEASGRRAAILSFPALLKIAEGRFSND